MARYVVGFMFSTDMKRVLLIEKKRPQWQLGKLNGIGGKVEDGENFYTAMGREFLEETGLRFDGWKFFCKLTVPPDKGWDDIFFAAATSGMMDSARSTTDEKIYEVDIVSIGHGTLPWGKPMEDDGGGVRALVPVLYNIPWLVRMAIDSLVNETCYDVVEQKT